MLGKCQRHQSDRSNSSDNRAELARFDDMAGNQQHRPERQRCRCDVAVVEILREHGIAVVADDMSRVGAGKGKGEEQQPFQALAGDLLDTQVDQADREGCQCCAAGTL